MANKTISIDLDAYERLKQVQRPNESFSQTIKRTVRPPIDVSAWVRAVQANPLSLKAVAAIRQHEEARHRPATRRR
jgi:predicted CopG family antitoxin